MNRIQVSIIEDNHFIRSGWEEILGIEANLEVIGSFKSAEEGLASDKLAQTDVLLLDIGLPGISGIEAVSKITANFKKIHVIMVSVFDDDQNVYDAICNGAIGYLHKKVSPDKLIEAIYDAVRGGSPMSPNIARKVIATFRNSRSTTEETLLNDRETEVLQHMSQGKSYSTIAADMFLSVDGIRYHIRNIYEKLQVHSRSAAIAEGFRKNLIRGDEKKK